MQIIDELEPTGAGSMPGAVGYLDFAGNLDFCIAIRTHRAREAAAASVQAGAGIVADSNPTAEYEETRDKARAMVRALELAAGGVVGRHGAGHRQLRLVHLQPGAVPGRAGREVMVRRNDETSRSTRFGRLAPERILISPGPGRPEDAGVTLDVIREFGGRAADARRLPRTSGDGHGVRRRGRARAGADARQDVDGRARRARRCSPGSPRRFRRRAITRWSSPKRRGRTALEVTARAKEDGLVMGLRHRAGRCTACSFTRSRS